MEQQTPAFIVKDNQSVPIKDVKDLEIQYEKQIFERLNGIKTNAEITPNVTPLSGSDYETARDEMNASYNTRYSDESDSAPSNFYAMSTENTSFASLTERANNVYATLKLLPDITDRMPLLVSLKEAYRRITVPNIRTDVATLYELLQHRTTRIDQSEVMLDCLIHSAQESKHYQAVFIALLADEGNLRLEAKPILDRVQVSLNQISHYLQINNIPFAFPELNDVVLAREIKNFHIIGNAYTEDFDRPNPSAFVASDEDQLDPSKVRIMKLAPLPIYETDPEKKEKQIERDAKHFVSDITHESIHFNKKDQQIPLPGSWEEAVNEMLTDYASLLLVSNAGLGDVNPEGLPTDWGDKTGYYQFIRVAAALEKNRIFTRDELYTLGMNQDFSSFIEAFDKRIKTSDKQMLQTFLQEIDTYYVISPDHFNNFSSSLETLTAETLFRATLEFGQEIGHYYFAQPGALALEIFESLPEWKDKDFTDFLLWFRRDDSREKRHQLLKAWVIRKKKKIK